MTNCAKCGAELIGSRKFCAACGAPTDPSSLKRSDPLGGSGPASSPAPTPAPQINVPSTAYGPPLAPGAPPVNPFAATASPASRATGSPYGPPPATTSNPPPPGAAPGPLDATAPAPPVSPLAVSNALSQRGAFQNAAGERIPPSAPSSAQTGLNSPGAPRPRTGTSPPPPMAGGTPAKKAPGTQIMPSLQNPAALGPRSGSSPPGSGSSPPAASHAKPPPQRTQVMDAASFARANPLPTPSPQPIAQPVAPPVAQPVPPSVAHQPQPPSVAHQPPPTTGQPYSHGQAPPGQWGGAAGGWGAPAKPAHGGYGGFGYAPGARVNVTWSNGQRYPATVSQVSGTQCLVVFPDGQQHWVEMQYLSPG